MKRLLVWLGLLGMSQFAGFGLAHAVIFSTSFPITGTAVNSTNVIGAGSGQAWWFDRTNGRHDWFGGVPTSAIDAGQYDDAATMYLDGSGILHLVRNNDANQLNSFSGLGSDSFGVSGALKIGGTNYAIIAGTTAGVRALNLATGELTPLPGNFDFSDASGLDAMIRPGGFALRHLAIGILRDWPQLDIYAAFGVLLDSVEPDGSYGLCKDHSFDVADNRIWFGTQGGSRSRRLFDHAYDFARIALPEPAFSLVPTNGQFVVNWVGTELQSSTNLLSWQTLTNAPQPYLAPASETAQFFRAVK